MIKWLAVILLTAATLSPGVAEVFYVTPAPQPCPSPCHTLDQYALNSSIFTEHKNITLIFLRGLHDLHYSLTFDWNELFLQSNHTENEVIINFRSNVQVNLKISTNLTITNVTLRSELSQRKIEIIGPAMTTLHTSLFHLLLERVVLVVQQVHTIHINKCVGSRSGLQFSNTLNISVISTHISGGDNLNYRNKYWVGIRLRGVVVHLRIYNSLITNCQRGITLWKSQLKVFIKNTRFEGNMYGVYIVNCKAQEMIIVSAKFERNNFGFFITRDKSKRGMTIMNTQVTGNIYGVFIQASCTTILILNCTISNNQKFGLLLRNTTQLSINNSYITGNRLGIVSITSTLSIQSTFISNNTVGMVIPTPNMFVPNGKDGNSSIQNCTFSFNSLSGMTLINSRGMTEVEDCSFYGNRGTPIIAYQSTFELMGETVFRDNTADRGGGLALYNSTVTFGPGSNTKFINNTALEFGGAIYIVSLPSILPAILIEFENVEDRLTVQIVRDNTLLQQSCFYSVSKVTETGTQVAFIGNTATLGGLSIYGPTLYTKDCLVTNEHFTFNDSALSSFKLQVSSDPSRVCFCINDVPESKTLILNETRYPGERFSVPVVLTGYDFGRVAGTVYTNVVGQNYTKVIDENQHVQATNLNCTRVRFNVRSQDQTDKSFILALTAYKQFTPDKIHFNKSLQNIFSDRRYAPCAKNQPCVAIYNTPVYVKVTLEDCPLGFELKDDGKCNCDQTLADLGVTCELKKHTGYITRKGTVWIGVDTRLNKTDVYYWHKKCPRDYCNSSEICVNPRDPDAQCNQNRGGVLCGGCQSKHSLQLGNNNCVSCGNNYTFTLLIVFATLGILLVVFISIMDLTVARGTINGLIFYANVVWRNNGILFSFRDRQNIGYYVITLPIAWINLDFGIETCFGRNLDQLTKSGLQFVFPVYIWCIAGLIILICHYSTRATTLFGNNSVAVLATLFLLSYDKLSKIITDTLIHANIRDWNNSIHKVWALDGNVSYDDPRHIGLIIVALLFFLLFWLPFTLTLLLVPFLRPKSHLRPLHWINKLKPFFDTYYGPFKHKKRHQVWTEILLLSRVVILVMFAITSTTYPYANILLMTVIATLLLVYSALVGLLYKKWYISFLEVLYLLNLVVLGEVLLLFPQDYFDNLEFNPVPAISVCVAQIQFIGVLIFHFVRCIMATKTAILEGKQKQITASREENEPTVHINIDTSQDYNCYSLRESLLSDSS